MEATTTQSLKRKDDFITVDNATKRVRTTDDGQMVPPTDVHDGPLSQATDAIPDSQLNEAHEVGARPEGDVGGDSGEQNGPTDLEGHAGDDVSDEDNVGNDTFIGGYEDDEDEDDYDPDWVPAGAIYVYWEHPDYEEKLADKYRKKAQEAMNSLLNRRLVDLVNEKKLWHKILIKIFTDKCWNQKLGIALREHMWARPWLGNVPDEQWGSRILFPYSPQVRVNPLRRLVRRGQFLGPSRLSMCIYSAPFESLPALPPMAGTEDYEAPSSGFETTGDAVIASTPPPVSTCLVVDNRADSIPPSTLAVPLGIHLDPGEQADLALEQISDSDSTTQNTVAKERRVQVKQGSSRYHHNDPYVRGTVWQDSEPLLWDMMPEVSMPL